MSFLLSSPTTGLTAHDAAWVDSDTLASSTNLLHSAVAASALITNTTAETVFSTGTFTIPANYLEAGDVILVTAAGTCPSTNGADTLIIRIRIGGVAGTIIAQSPTIDVADNDDFVAYAQATVRTAGASGTLVGCALGQGPDAPSTVALAWGFAGAQAALNTTAGQAAVCTAQWSAGSTADQVRLDVFTVTVQKAA